jgi:transcriptional regulator with XRE-family HTH domain
MKNDLRNALAHMPLSRSELARRAGVSRTTALSVSEDQSRARVDTLRELALALGYDLSIELERASDPQAAAAARVLLGDLEVDWNEDQGFTTELDVWLDRLPRYVRTDADEGLDDNERSASAIGMIAEAARVSGAHHREGRVLLSGRTDVDRLVSAGRASQARWVLSGSAALEALGAPVGDTVVMWSEDAKRVAELFGDTHRRVNLHSAANLIIAPAHPSVFIGSTTVEDVNLVSPIQGLIDAFANGGRDREIATELARSW